MMGLAHGVAAGLVLVPLLVDPDGTLHVNLVTAGAIPHVIVDSGALVAVVDGPRPSTLRPIGVATAFANAALPAGISDQTFFTVLAGEHHVIDNISLRYLVNITGVVVSVSLLIAGVQAVIYYNAALVIGTIYNIPVPGVLQAADYAKVHITGGHLNDELDVWTLSHKIAV